MERRKGGRKGWEPERGLSIVVRVQERAPSESQDTHFQSEAGVQML